MKASSQAGMGFPTAPVDVSLWLILLQVHAAWGDSSCSSHTFGLLQQHELLSTKMGLIALTMGILCVGEMFVGLEVHSGTAKKLGDHMKVQRVILVGT
eukprot:scaffold30175_cov19-Tisochrysis_lutea.AAC.1